MYAANHDDHPDFPRPAAPQPSFVNKSARRVQIVKKNARGLQTLVAVLARALVDAPEAVSVSEVEGGRSIIISLAVAKEDLGKIIGRSGRTAQAIRTLLTAAAAKEGKHAVLEIIE